MLMKVFSVYDCKTEAYMQPFFMNTKGEAIRGFTELSNDKTTNVGKYPSDFTLFELGTFDNSNARFTLHSTVISLGCAIEFVHTVN